MKKLADSGSKTDVRSNRTRRKIPGNEGPLVIMMGLHIESTTDRVRLELDASFSVSRRTGRNRIGESVAVVMIPLRTLTGVALKSPLDARGDATSAIGHHLSQKTVLCVPYNRCGQVKTKVAVQ